MADTERIATALARGVCKAFNVPYDTTSNGSTTPSTPPTTPNSTCQCEVYKKDIEELKKKIDDLSVEVNRELISLNTRVLDGESVLETIKNSGGYKLAEKLASILNFK